MTKTEIIQEIKDNLASNYIDSTNMVIEKIYDRMCSIASDVAHRQKNDEKLIPYAVNATIETYLRRGKEGTTGYSEGSESESYIDIEEKLRKDIISIRRMP